MKRTVYYIARRISSDESTIAIITCTMVSDGDAETAIKKAVKVWATTKASTTTLNYTGGDFNYGDLAIESSSELVTCLKNVGITNLVVQVISLDGDTHNFDTNLNG